VDERTRFVLEYERGLWSMAELCRIYGVSRETGYQWLRRYAREGMEVCAIAAGRRISAATERWSCAGSICARVRGN
jgi:transposase